jgi:hypothetical protein
MLGVPLCDTLIELRTNRSPLLWLVHSNYRWLALGVIFVLGMWMVRSKWCGRVFWDVGSAIVAIRAFEKGADLVEEGIRKARGESVNNGMARLEGVAPYFSEMPEYREIVAKGRSWLDSH